MSRGDLLAPVGAPVGAPARVVKAMVCWMDAEPMAADRRYLVKHTTRTTKAIVDGLVGMLDIATLAEHQVDGGTLPLNAIGRVRFRTRDPLLVDAYAENRATGAFIVIDEVTNHTVAAGMIVASAEGEGR